MGIKVITKIVLIQLKKHFLFKLVYVHLCIHTSGGFSINYKLGNCIYTHIFQSGILHEARIISIGE